MLRICPSYGKFVQFPLPLLQLAGMGVSRIFVNQAASSILTKHFASPPPTSSIFTKPFGVFMGLMEKMRPGRDFCGKPIHNPGRVCYI